MNDSSPTRIRLAVRTRGSGPTLLLLHGGMGSWTHWVRNIDVLAQRFTVHAVDLPGYGASPSVARDIAQDDYVSLVINCLDAIVGPEPFLLTGFSFGAIISAMTTARIGERVRRLALVGPGGLGPSAPLDTRPIPSQSVDVAVRRATFRHNLGAMMIASPDQITEEAVDIYEANFASTRFDGRRFSVIENTPRSLARIQCPAMVVIGARDALNEGMLDARVAALKAVRPDARIVVIPGAGHWVQYEAADEVNRLLLEFLSP